MQLLEIPWYALEPAARIERATCGLRISDSPTSDNLTLQEITNQDAPDMGADGGDWFCPGSSVVADEDGNLWLEDCRRGRAED